MQSIGQYLAEHPFFAGLDEDILGQLAACASEVHLPPGAYLLREGEPADRFYAVRHGRVSIEVRRPAGRPVVFDTAEDGEIVGWSWLIPPNRAKFDARATTETSAVAFDAACLRGRCEVDPHLGYALLQRVARVMDHRLQSARLRLLDLYAAEARA